MGERLNKHFALDEKKFNDVICGKIKIQNGPLTY